MVKCGDCCDNTSEKLCECCKRMQKNGEWLWDIDTGHRMCRCPECGGRLSLGAYAYWNPYRYCPYCGRLNIPQEDMKLILMEV